jgi:ATP-dependent DNA ligase
MLSKSILPFYEVEGEDENKIEFIENILMSGGEGGIVKNLHAPYISGLRSTRNHRAAMKVKQSISTMLSSNSNLMEDFDVFITGANPPKSDRIKDMIGSLSCSVYIKKNNGQVVEHEIANVTGISHDWKKKLAAVDVETGKITLNPEYEGKVIAIDGLALTASKLKFQHATLKNKGNLEFKAKNPSECVWEEDTLKEMTLTRGQ